MKYDWRTIGAAGLLLLSSASPRLWAGDKQPRISDDDKVDILRGVMAEQGKAKVVIPRSKRPLPFEATGKYDQNKWAEMGRELGPAARVGDLVQITKITFEGDRIILELNGGLHHGSWKDHVSVGMGTTMSPISQGPGRVSLGTVLALEFHKPVPPLDSDGLKRMLSPILNFEKETAVKSYLDTLPPEMQKAIKEKRAIAGMDRDGVLLALGKPRLKERESRDGVDTEDWIYGEPPGKVTFVTFAGSKVIKVKEAWAALGGSTVQPGPVN